MLSNEWTVERFYPLGYLPDGVRLTPYGGEYSLDEVATAHADMEAGNATGKLVLLP